MEARSTEADTSPSWPGWARRNFGLQEHGVRRAARQMRAWCADLVWQEGAQLLRRRHQRWLPLRRSLTCQSCAA